MTTPNSFELAAAHTVETAGMEVLQVSPILQERNPSAGGGLEARILNRFGRVNAGFAFVNRDRVAWLIVYEGDDLVVKGHRGQLDKLPMFLAWLAGEL